MTDTTTPSRKWMQIRILILTSSVLVLPVMVMHRAFELQVTRAMDLKEQAEGQYLREVPTAPKRGAIYDRDGAELAVSIDVDSVWANPKQLRKSGVDVRALSKDLGNLLSIDEAWLTQRLSQDRYFVWVKRRVSAAQGKAVQALNVAGVSIAEEPRRFYPNRELAAHLLGFANVDGRGIEGLELTLEDKLRGSVSTAPAVLDRRGKVVYSEQLTGDSDGQGNDVTLTIDKTLQHFAERELELAVRTAEAHAGSVVVLDPVKGEVLAVANYPTFNPNEPHRFSSAERRNRAVVDSFEPGSTLKPFTVAGALAAGAVSANDVIDCSQDSLQVDGGKIHDVHRFERLTPAEILTFSSNIGASKIGSALGRQRLHRALTAFGFGQTTGSGIPGEAAGSLRPYQRWYPMDAATIPFGQGMSTTTLQLASAMGALANHGRLMEPHLIKRVADAHGQTLEQAIPRIRQQVVPENTARMVTDMLVGVTGQGGTGTEAAVNGYLVAGKTGTAQKSSGKQGSGYTKDKWVSSFVGYAPAQKPRLVIAVVLDEPMIAHQGGAVAAPAFRRIMEASLRHLGVPATVNGSGVPSSGEPLARAGQRTQAAAPLVGQLPPPPQPSAARMVAVGPGEAVVPNLLGRTAREAVVQARQGQFIVTMAGSGVVSAQDLEPGAVVARGAMLGLRLATPPNQAPPGVLGVDLASAQPRVSEPSPAPAAPPEWPKTLQQPTLVSVARGGQDG